GDNCLPWPDRSNSISPSLRPFSNEHSRVLLTPPGVPGTAFDAATRLASAAAAPDRIERTDVDCICPPDHWIVARPCWKLKDPAGPKSPASVRITQSYC